MGITVAKTEQNSTSKFAPTEKGWQEIFILPSFILFIENFYGKLAILSMSP